MRRIGRRAAPGPAPPRRWHRRWRPIARRASLWAFPIVLVAGGYGTLALSRTPTGQALLHAAAERGLAASASFGLVVSNIEVEGRETTEAATILAALAAHRGTPILAVSPSQAKQQLERLAWVRSAAIERHLPGTLVVRLVERHPLAVWQHAGKQELIDREGEVIPVKDLSRFSRVPTVVGQDAPRHAAALIDMLAREPELATRVTAAIRVDDRRWNLRIDNAIDVLMPEENPEAAWTHLASLERQDKLLQREIQIIDMRLPDRVVLRISAPSAKQAAPAKKPHSAGPHI